MPRHIVDYAQDFELLCLIYDISLARSLMQTITIAEEKRQAPENLCANQHYFETFWRHREAVLSDVCRVHGLPNLFLTIAPAEWKFPLHAELFDGYAAAGRLTEVQGLLTLHLNHVLDEMLKTIMSGGEDLSLIHI